jgi:hypothetical protein
MSCFLLIQTCSTVVAASEQQDAFQALFVAWNNKESIIGY